MFALPGNTVLSVCYKGKNIYLRFLDLIVVFVNFVFSISQLKMLTYCQWGLRFVLLSVCQDLHCIFLFYYLKIEKSKSPRVVWTVVKDFSKKPTADCCFNFLFKFPFLSKKSGISTFPQSPLNISASLQL